MALALLWAANPCIHNFIYIQDMTSGSNLHWVDYVVIVGYFAVVIAVGIISSIKVDNDN